jgi:hypothetical protein
MSIEKILRLEAEKKRLALVPPPLESKLDSVSKSKQEEVGITKDNQIEVRVSKSKQVETSPTKNYTKVPNSVARQAIPEKFFRGLSKHTYDVLYLQTRGAIVPKRTVQLTKDELVKMTGLSKDAVKLHIRYLKDSGLVKSHPTVGSRAGWEYEVLVPEEIVQDGISVSKSNGVSVSKGGENLHLHTEQNLLTLTHTNVTENKQLNDAPKTSLKTNTKNDDGEHALFSGFIDRFQTAAKKLTGAPLSKYEREKWERLADLLVLELETASRHASNPVSSVPAFLTKVLSSKLLNQKPAERMSKPKSGAKPDTVGKYYPELDGSDDEIKPLNDESRQAALDLIREFKDDREFLDSYRKWYTEEDWKWLLKELEIND